MTAFNLMAESTNTVDLMSRAESVETVAIEQDWEHEATLYTFDDNTVLMVSGSSANAFYSIEKARESIL